MLTYRIAICEDNDAVREQLKKLCTQIISEWGIRSVPVLFPSADELDAAMRENPDSFDLLLLDIQMEGMSGMELAKELYARRSPARVLFITGCADYALEGHSVHPVHYLLKPVEAEELDEALFRDWQERCQSSAVLLRSGGRTVSLPVGEIRFMESLNRAVVVHLAAEEQTFPTTLVDAERLTPPGQFARCHNSYLVNLDWVKEIGRTEVLLRDGDRLPVGRRYYRDFQSALIRRVNR